MKKIKMNAAKLQLNKEKIVGLAMGKILGGGDLPTGNSVSICNDQCAETWSCTLRDDNCGQGQVFPPSKKPGCVKTVDYCQMATEPGVSGC